MTLPRIDELELHYQPIIDLESGSLAGAEALVRWRHPDRGLLLPRDFIGLCEETGFITDVGEWVLTEASRQIAAWNDGYPPSQRLWISINISARQLQSTGFASTIARAVHDTGIRDQLVVEIRGTVLLDGSSDMLDVLLAIQREGVRIALDDFATSYASRAYLKRFPITVLKIDRSFIADMPPERRSRLLAAAIRSLGRDSQVTAIAGGIETAEQDAALRSLGPMLGQGYFFSHPKPATEIQELLGSRQPVLHSWRHHSSERWSATS
ncbi:MAG TPA: EAL domain-containing protein [Candidatus Dormibacteraeota bacterium]